MTIIGVTLVLGVLFFWKYPNFIAEIGSPKITRNLPANWEEGKIEFNRRVQAAYPIGMSEADIISQLKKTGFEVNDASAEFSRSIFPCKLDWEINWTLNPNGTVKDITSDYSSACT